MTILTMLFHTYIVIWTIAQKAKLSQIKTIHIKFISDQSPQDASEKLQFPKKSTKKSAQSFVNALKSKTKQKFKNLNSENYRRMRLCMGKYWKILNSGKKIQIGMRHCSHLTKLLRFWNGWISRFFTRIFYNLSKLKYECSNVFSNKARHQGTNKYGETTLYKPWPSALLVFHVDF